MAEGPDYYEILQVHPRASALMIKKAYRTLLLAGGHPDLGGNPVETQLLTEAYEVLSNPDRRMAYDRRRSVGRPAPTTIIVSICPHCGVFNRVRSETKLLIARCGKCGQGLGKAKAPTMPLKLDRKWPWKWILGGVSVVFLGLAGAGGYALWSAERDPLAEAIALEDRGQLSSAAERLQALIATQPRHLAAHQHLGQVYEAQKNLEAAVAEYRTAVDISPTTPKSHYLLGRALLRQGRFQEAEKALRTATDYDGQDVGALVTLGKLLVKTDRLDEAVKIYRQAVPLDARNSDLHYNLAMVYQLRGEAGEAEREHREALAIDPRHREALVNLGKLYQDRGAYQEALSQFREAAVLRYEDPDLHFRMAELYRQSGNAAQAIREFQVAQGQAKANPILRDRIDRALKALGG
ncbi:Chaperone protein DnaJ [compost metagenome]